VDAEVCGGEAGCGVTVAGIGEEQEGLWVLRRETW
jgi:hypothetical protein